MKHTWIKLAAFLLSLLLMGGMLLSCLDASEQGGEGASEGDASQGTTGENQSPIGTTVNAPTVADFDPNKTYPLINYFDLDMSEYVQLGHYQNLSLTVASTDISVTDAQVQAQMDAVLAEHHPNAKITDRAVQMGDTIVMDYVGKLDGVAFQ